MCDDCSNFPDHRGQRIKNTELMNVFRPRAFLAGGLTAILGLVALFLSVSEAPVFWQGMLNHGWWAVAITLLIGAATAAALWFRRYKVARILVVMDTVVFLGTWGIVQLPYVLPPDLTVVQATSPSTTMRDFFAMYALLRALQSLHTSGRKGAIVSSTGRIDCHRHIHIWVYGTGDMKCAISIEDNIFRLTGRYANTGTTENYWWQL